MDERQLADDLQTFEGGDRAALDALLPEVYEELRRIAHRELRRERPDHTLSTTEVVHEAYLKLLDHARVAPGARVRFLAVAATAMRRALIDHARRRDALKRGSGQELVPLADDMLPPQEDIDELLLIDEALTALAELDERRARVVECRYFAGLTEEETAAALGITARTVRRDWVKARAWLYQQLHDARLGVT